MTHDEIAEEIAMSARVMQRLGEQLDVLRRALALEEGKITELYKRLDELEP